MGSWHCPLKRLPIGADNIAEPIAVVIMAIATLIMAMPTQPTRITATPTGHTVITATAGDQASASVSDVAGVGATKEQERHGTRLKGATESST